MKKVVFETQGLLNLDALKVFGLSAKPATISPIGYFGTGLKYAIAVLIRKNCKVQILLGHSQAYDVIVEQEGFRGSLYQGIYLQECTTGEKTKLPFTTHLGANWELWGAFRELYCNTVDEQGYTSIQENPKEEINKTKIIVENEEFVEIFNERFKEVFIPEDIVIRNVSTGIQIIDKPTEYIFYRGVRVFKTEKPCLMTYNILSEIKLTEDRTVANIGAVKSLLNECILKTNDKNVLDKVLNSTEEDWETNFSFYINQWDKPSAEFIEVGSKCKKARIKNDLFKISEAYITSKEKEKEEHFLHKLIDNIEKEHWGDFTLACKTHKEELKGILEVVISEL